jgi:hypothetical protein
MCYREKYIRKMLKMPVVVCSITGKSISGIKKQGGFARLVRGSHALEV